MLGEPTEQQGRARRTSARSGCGSRRRRRSSTRPSARAARARTRSCGCATCSTPCSSGSPQWEERDAYRGVRGVVNVGAIQRRLRVARRRGRRTGPTSSSTCACRRRCRWRTRGARSTGARARRALPTRDRVGDLRHRARRRDRRGPPLVGAIDAAHEEVFGAAPERDVARWFSDASALTRYGIPTVNYGTSSGPAGARARARTSRSTGSSTRRASTRWRRRGCAASPNDGDRALPAG